MWPLIPPKAAPHIRPSLTLFFGLVGAFLLTILPHVQQLPLWVSAAVVMAIIFRSIGEVRRWPLPSPAFCGVLALCLLAGIYLQFGTIFGRDAGTAFMTALLAIKFFELRGPRDVALIIFCSFFVVMSSLLYSQVIELFIYCLIMMWVLTALLLRTSMGDMPDNRLLHLLRTSALIFLQALPLTLFLFFFLPRYPGLLQLGLGDSSIGLTDKVEPGSIWRLAEDDSTAMTVKFTGRVFPSPDAMYWRAIVLWDYENGAWVPGAGASPLKTGEEGLPREARESPLINQEITIWPHLHQWLFALDTPVTLAQPVQEGSVGPSQALNGSVLRLTDPYILDHEERYTVSSAPLLGPEELDSDLRKIALALPNEHNDRIDPRVRALATQLQQGCANEDAYIRSVLYYFRHGGFVYNDAPGPMGQDALANFLLKSKNGFCEHYASAFAVLMRLGGCPARLVVGYQGAQFNPYKNIYVVKQSNAHCWDEVWIDSESHWRRVDPTAILSGGENLTGAADRAREAAGESLSIEVAHHRLTFVAGSSLPDWMRQALLEGQLRRQELEADWDDWIFSYDPETQGRLAQILGLGTQSGYVLGLACLAAFAICGAILGWIVSRRAAVSPVENFYAKFCRNMAQRGVPRAVWEGPLAYTDRAAEAFPEERDAIAKAGQIVAQARYGAALPLVTPAELKSLLLSITFSDLSAPAAGKEPT
jgi:transglutaminase-like putative cysteine protease